MRGHPLEERGGRELRRESRGHRDETVGRDQRELRIGAGDPGVGHPVSRGMSVDIVADLQHLAGSLGAGREREVHRVAAGALLHVDHVHPGRVEADQHLPCGRVVILHLLDDEHLRPSVFPYADRFHASPLRCLTLQPPGLQALRPMSCAVRGRAFPVVDGAPGSLELTEYVVYSRRALIRDRPCWRRPWAGRRRWCSRQPVTAASGLVGRPPEGRWPQDPVRRRMSRSAVFRGSLELRLAPSPHRPSGGTTSRGARSAPRWWMPAEGRPWLRVRRSHRSPRGSSRARR